MQIDQVYEELLMKMEVLSVQNHIQGQFGVIGSTKVKDWSSPLTPPPPPPPPLPPTQQHQNQQQQQQATNSSNNIQPPTATQSLPTPPPPPPIQQPPTNNTRNINDYNNKPINNHINQLNLVESQCDIDCVDGRLSTTPKTKFMIQQPTQYHHQQQRQELQQPQQQQYQHQQHAHYYYHNHQNFTTSAMNSTITAASASANPNGIADGNTKLPLAATTAAAATTSNARYAAYNNNLLYCGDAAMAIAATETPTMLLQTPTTTADIQIDTNAITELSQRLQAELRTAKSRHLSCTEVSIPWDLTPRIAAEIIRMSEREPCGIRGCTIFIEFEDEPNNIRRIASFKMDSNTVSTFELYLTLKQDKSGWTSLLPQFLKNLTRSSTILISPDFTLTKNKLYSGE